MARSAFWRARSKPLATQPLTYWKNAAQQGLGFTLNPRPLYRGRWSRRSVDGTLTAFQFAASGWFQKLFAGGVVRELSLPRRSRPRFLAGARRRALLRARALHDSAAARWGRIVAQHSASAHARDGRQPGRALARLRADRRARRILLRGLPRSARRSLEQKLDDVDADSRALSPFARNFIASTASGLAAAALTHPADTVKSCMQGDVEARRTARCGRPPRALPHGRRRPRSSRATPRASRDDRLLLHHIQRGESRAGPGAFRGQGAAE